MIKALMFVVCLSIPFESHAQYPNSLDIKTFANVAKNTKFSFWYQVGDREKYYYRDMAFAVSEANYDKRVEVETKICHKENPVEKMKKTITRKQQEERRRLTLDRKMGRQILEDWQEKHFLDICKSENKQMWREDPSEKTLACADKEILFAAFKKRGLLSEYEVGKAKLERCLETIHGGYAESDDFPYYNGSFIKEYLEEFWNKKSRKCYFEDVECE